MKKLPLNALRHIAAANGALERRVQAHRPAVESMTILEQSKPSDEARDSEPRSGSVSSCNDLFSGKVVVFYLIREPGECDHFLASYHHHAAGLDHELVMVVKGSHSKSPCGFNVIKVSDFGRSLHAFWKVIKIVNYPEDTVIVFLNSWSRIVCDGWLERLACVAKRSEVGMAGCSASLESFASNKPALWRCLLFPPWPNPHLTTNGVAMRLAVARKFWPWFCWNKPLEHCAESGWWGLTNRLRRSGMECVVIGIDSEYRLGASLAELDIPAFRPGWPLMVTDRRALPGRQSVQ